MSRAVLFAVLALLLCDASGVIALVSPETCTSVSDTAPDGKCPALCARCCCGQPVVAVTPLSCTGYYVSTSTPDLYTPTLTTGSPHDILHVPK